MLNYRNNNKSIDFLFLRHKWNPEIIEYYFYKVFRTISFSLISLFIPVFLFAELGYSMFEVMLFFLINELIFLLVIPFSGKVIEKIGIKHSILLHLPGMMIFTYGMRFLSTDFYADIILIFVLLLFRNIPKAPMMSAESIFVANNILSHKGSEGSSLAKVKISLIIATLVSPLVGGIITYYYGFEIFFNVSIFFMFLAIIPLLLTKDQYFHSTKSPRNIVKYVFQSVPKNFHIAEGARRSIDSILWIIWPLFLYIIVESTLNLGFLTSLSTFLSIFISYYIGKKIDIGSSKKLLKKATKVYAMVFFFRSVFPNQILIVFFDVINKILDPVVMLPYQKFYFKFIKSNRNILEIAIASSFITELYYFLSLVFLVLYFGLLELFNIEVSYFIFVLLFFIYGLLTLFMTKISKLKNK